MKTCINHPNRKVKARELCGTCYQKQLKIENPEFHEKQKLNSSKWHKLNKDKREEYVKRRKQYYKEHEENNPEYKLKRRNKLLLRKYGIDHNDYLKQLEYQNNKCAICHKGSTPGKYFHVDHCHNTGRFRGLLCHQCNWYMGLIDNDKEIKIRLSMYGCITTEVHPDIRNKQRGNK